MMVTSNAAWPALPLEEWKDTYETLHRWIQIVGKVRLALSPWLNHSWHATLYVTARGLTTRQIPHATSVFQIDFDFVDHQLVVRTCTGDSRSFALRPQSVAAFFRQLMAALGELGLPVTISHRPSELADTIPFAEDEQHASYDAAPVVRYWLTLVQVDRVFSEFRARFLGKCSPVHLFWGALDLAVTRFTGRVAPQHPGGVPNLPDWVAREAYSHEVSSAGFWPGGGAVNFPAFYSYAYPEPDGYRVSPVKPAAAFYHPELREFLLPYDEVRTAADPDAVLLDFLQSTYEAAANCGKWDRAALEQTGDPRLAKVRA
jgi:hypothetical protein